MAPRARSTCDVHDGVPVFVAARAGTSHLHKSPTSRALFIRARPNNPYKRYVTSTCARDRGGDARVRRAIDAALRAQADRAEAKARALAAYDAAATRALPAVFEQLRGYRLRTGAVQANVERLAAGIKALDPQGRAAIVAWLTREDAAWPYSGRELVARANKAWTSLSESSKRNVLKQVAHAQLLVDAPAVQLGPVPGVAPCGNLRIQRGRSDDYYDPITMELVSPYDDFASVDDPESGASACTLASNLVDMCFHDSGRLRSPFDTVVHWNRQLAPDVLAERGRIDVHPDGGAPRELQIPVFRLQRYALA